VLAGDVEEARALALAEAYFGDLPAGEPPPPVSVPSTPLDGQRLVLEDRVELPRLYVAWRSPAMFAPGDAELDLVGDLLANGRTSRLYRTLVYERRIAVDVAAAQGSRELESFFLIVVTAAPGHGLDAILDEIDRELGRVTAGGPSAEEMERSVAQAEAHFMYRLQTVGGFGGKSDQLNAYNVLRGTPGYFAADLERYRAATAAMLRDAAERHLVLDRRVALSVVPRGRLDLAIEGSSAVGVS
jgi:zinc protease